VEIIGECGNGISAVESILERSPDVVLLDIQMPGMDGFEVLRALPRERLRVFYILCKCKFLKLRRNEWESTRN